MGGTCNTYVEDKAFIQHFNGKTQGREHLADLGIDGRVILKCILKK